MIGVAMVIKMAQYLCFDPGHTTGWALMNKEGVLYDGHIEGGLEGFNEWMMDNPGIIGDACKVIIEDYMIFTRKAMSHAGSKLVTSKVIGAATAWAAMYRIPVVMQDSDILPTAEKWAQVFRPSDHSKSHRVCAALHGYYYMIGNNLRPTALELARVPKQ